MENRTDTLTGSPATYPPRPLKLWQLLGLAGFVVMVLLNFLANWLPLNGLTTGALSARYPNLFVPAGVTFSIWGIIYLLLALYTGYQLGSLQGTSAEARRLTVRNISGWYFLTCLLNAGWILAWHYLILPLSLAIMLLLLVSLLRINLGLVHLRPHLSRWTRFLTLAPFGLYLGWICIATIANVTAWLVAINWQGAGLSEPAWAVIMIVIGIGVGLFAALALANGYLALAVAWALTGIVLKRQQSLPDYPAISWAAGAGAVVLLALAVYLLVVKKSTPVAPATAPPGT
jgi:hypothetical protein